MRGLTKEQLEAKKAYHENKADFYAKKLNDIKPEPIGFKYQNRCVK